MPWRRVFWVLPHAVCLCRTGNGILAIFGFRPEAQVHISDRFGVSKRGMCRFPRLGVATLTKREMGRRNVTGAGCSPWTRCTRGIREEDGEWGASPGDIGLAAVIMPCSGWPGPAGWGTNEHGYEGGLVTGRGRREACRSRERLQTGGLQREDGCAGGCYGWV